MKSVVRILAQLALIGPLVLLAPWAVIMGVGALFMGATGQVDSVSKLLGYGFGWLGLLGLLASVLVPRKKVRDIRMLRRVVLALLICGFVATGAIITEDADPIGHLSRLDWFGAWLLGGPVIVGVWNLTSILRKEPNAERSTAP